MCCHTDACLGGFVLPFARKLGYPVPAWDFSVPGVTSMSLDSHKFGMAHKVSSSGSAVQVCQACHADLTSEPPQCASRGFHQIQKAFFPDNAAPISCIPFSTAAVGCSCMLEP